MSNHQLTTLQIGKKTLRKVGAFCRKNRYIQRYWVEGVLEKAVKTEKGSGSQNHRSP
jgi:hypothetical protein